MLKVIRVYQSDGFVSLIIKKKSIAYNLLKSEDIYSAINCVKRLGCKVQFSKNKCEIIGTGLKYKIKKNLTINAGNSGTLGRLILGLLINAENKVTLIGDKSLSKEIFQE